MTKESKKIPKVELKSILNRMKIKNIPYQNFSDATKAVLRGKSIVKQTSVVEKANLNLMASAFTP